MVEILIGIDIGTGSTKAVAYDINYPGIVDSSHRFYPTDYQGDQHEQNPALIFSAFCEAFRELTDKLPPHRLAGIVFSSALHSLIAVDNNGTPLTNCLIWSDNRSKKQAKDIRQDARAREVYYKTGTPIHPMSPLCKIAYIRENTPEVFDKTHKFISIKSYILHRLGFPFLVDHSVASATGLFDIEKLAWCPIALELAGISTSHLSDPVPTTFQISSNHHEQAKSIGIPEGTSIIVGGGDGPLANLGSLTLGEGQGCLTLGTSGAMRVTTKQILKDPDQRIFNYIIDDHLYAAGGAVNSGGIVLRWLQKLFPANNHSDANFEELLEQIRKVEPGAAGLVFLPWILGERAPVWETEAKGIYHGVSFQHEQQHFIRAGLEGICFNLLNISKIMESLSGKIDEINFNGGLSQSTFFCQMLADIFKVVINVTPKLDLSAFGAIMLGLKALGHISDFNQIPVLNRQPLTFYPDKKDSQAYEQSFARFLSLINAKNLQ